MKVELHIPVEQYGFVAVEFDHEMEDKEIRDTYDRVKAAFAAKPENTMPEKEYTTFLAKMLKGEKYSVDEWEAMNPAQQRFCNLLKNAIARK